MEMNVGTKKKGNENFKTTIPTKKKIMIGQKQLENVESFKYLRSILTNDGRRTVKLNVGFLLLKLHSTRRGLNVDKKNQLDVTFCILYFSSNSCSTCFGQPCAHHQELTTA